MIHDRPAIGIDDVRRAAAATAGQVLETPLLPAPRLSELTGATVFVKHENMQPTGAFKERGALNRLLALSADERARGVVAMSAGNHAQAVAYHARRLALTTFAASGALAGLAGALAAVQFGALGFAGGFGLGLKALAAAILGGVGSVAGALIGGLAIGLFETLWSAYLPIEGRDLALFVVLVLFITLKPEGLFGAAPPLKVTS